MPPPVTPPVQDSHKAPAAVAASAIPKTAVPSVVAKLSDGTGTGRTAEAGVSQPPAKSAASGGEAASSPGPAAVSLLNEPDLPGPAILLPVTGKTGAAAYSRNGVVHVVLDQPQAMDLSLLKDNPVFGSIAQTILPDGTDLRFRVAPTAQPRLLRHGGNWAVSLSALPAPNLAGTIAGRSRSGVMLFQTKMPGRIVVLDDEVTGGRLLVGTQREQGQRVASQHSGPALSILPTWQGLVVQPASDRLVLRATGDGFELSTPDGPTLLDGWPEQTVGAWPDGRAMTRMFDFGAQTVAGQNRQLTQALQDVAGLPKTARYAARVKVAQAMLAEGLDVEAVSVVQTAITDDPRHRDDPVAARLSAVAAWLSAEAGGDKPLSLPADPSLFDGSDEATLWRSLLWPDRPNAAHQAAALAVTWPLILRYPSNLRRLVLRPASALLAAGGQDKAWAALLAAFPDAVLDVSRASHLQFQGRTDESLALLDKVARRPDRLARAEALTLAVEEQMKAGRLTPAAAAEKLESLICTWRGDSRELHLRQRVAQLHAQTGAWRKAFAELGDAEAIFPDERGAIRQAQVDMIDGLMHSDQAAKFSALDLVNLAEQAARLPVEIDQGRFAPMLAERLMALDLPTQAEPIIRNLFLRAGDAQSKAEIGVQLAELQAGQADATGALAVLDASSDTGLTPSVITNRALLRGRLLASLGKASDALALLAAEPSPKARELEVTIMEARHDWRGAADVLGRMLNDGQFTASPTAAQQQLLLHVARDRSEAGDTAELRQLRKHYAARFQSGPNAALFAVLTAEPVQSPADLTRSAKELGAMRALPASLSQPAS